MARKFSVVAGLAPGADLPATPTSLGIEGATLWRRVHAEYCITDVGSLVLLEMACAAVDRASSCAQQIAAEGQTLKIRGGVPKMHPLIPAELSARAQAARLLGRLGLHLEPLRGSAGHPPGIGYTGD